ncbi:MULTISPECIES: COG1361 S-layer family protein [unclassified Archaeoglobus]|uniref:COG1361 S-layer family protein n=1 Tax=unclassified Archaeoglobus TaxID=2643606 RepID=UPI0025B9F418|nr:MULTISPECIES: COG1361 S-layer family protein [unclassified Archaeoglobus]
MFRKFFAVFLVLIAVQTALAVEAEDEPELAAYSTNTILKAGEINELRIVLMNTAKPENVMGGSLEREIIQNATLTAYNLEIWLVSEDFDVKSGKIYLQSLPPSASVTLPFLVSVPATFSGESVVKLKVKYERVRSVDVVWNGSNYTAEYDYTEESEEFEIRVEVLEVLKPDLMAVLLTPEIYSGNFNRLSILLANTGLREMKSLTVRIEGFEDVSPSELYVPSLPPSSSVQIDFSVFAKNETEFKVVAHYTYFDEGKLVEESRKINLSVEIKNLGGRVEIIPENPEIQRGRGILDLAVMNTHLNPVSQLKIKIEAPDEFDLSREEVVVGTLPAGGVVRVQIPYSLDDDALSGNKVWNLNLSYILNTQKLEKRQESRYIVLNLGDDPYFVVTNKPTVYHGENIVKFEVENTGGYAEDIHFKLLPSPGLRVKMPEAFLERVGKGESFSISFYVDVDEDVIPNEEYRVEIRWEAENQAGKDVEDSVYGYLVVEERPWLEKYWGVLVLVMAIVIVVGVGVSRKRMGKT